MAYELKKLLSIKGILLVLLFLAFTFPMPFYLVAFGFRYLLSFVITLPVVATELIVLALRSLILITASLVFLKSIESQNKYLKIGVPIVIFLVYFVFKTFIIDYSKKIIFIGQDYYDGCNSCNYSAIGGSLCTLKYCFKTL